MNKVSNEILIVGAGPAGLAAAAAASLSANVTILDDNPFVGGQIWRAERGKIKATQIESFRKAVDSGHVKLLNNAQVYGLKDARCLLAETKNGTIEVEFGKLILATGARERFLPFPGWTLPNVMGAGGLQALIKGGFPIANKRIVIAGTGPLLLAVAEYLKRKGANVLAVAEQTPAAKLLSFGVGLFRSPAKLLRAAAIRARLMGVQYLTDCWVTSASGDGKLESVTVIRNGKSQTIDCDYLASGFHLVPNNELAEIVGCKIENGSVTVDEFQQTSVPDVFCAGEPTGIAGVESAIVKGEIAGLAATERLEQAQKLFAKRDKARIFGNALNNAFALRDELKSLAEPSTFVCRCEDVEYAELREFDNFREAKLQTRCGMGPCQGRICGAATQFLFGWESPSVRTPIFPVKMENL
jgi:NADPH-dependent 2,4-dienoyl-CoA reductase/sulfur reductase-like enzyme